MPQPNSEDSNLPPADHPIDLSELAATADVSEFYSPVPDGYQKGRHKYVVVMGTVMSGLGKGIFASSLAKLLQDKGLTVAPIKMEGYLNIDAGTLNPFRHGEVFVLDDGTECDMDLGTYERVLNQDLCRRNFVTSGQIYSDILRRERHGGYLGRDVQMIPHVTGEVKRRLRELAMQGDGSKPADVVFVEVGGTVGDHENAFYIEALRELAFEEGPDSVCFVALTYVIEPPALGEQKSKAAQLGVKRLLEAGVQPHIIACRAGKPCSTTVMQKIAMFSNVPIQCVFSMHDRTSIYTIPEAMRSAGLDREVLSILDMHSRVNASHEDTAREQWRSFTDRVTKKRAPNLTIGLIGKYASVRDAYASIVKCVEHCSVKLGCEAELRWIESVDVSDATARAALEGIDAVIVPGGFGKRGIDGKIACVRYCRENGIPFLGICLGFQMAVIDFARNVLELKNAHSTEFDASSDATVISELPEQKKIEQLGGSMRLGGQDVTLAPHSLASRLHGGDLEIRERFRHRWEVDPSFIDQLEAGGLRFSGRHPLHPIMQVLELPLPGESTDGPTHPYFIATQYHPELTGRPIRPQPLFLGLLAAALRRIDPSAALPSDVADAITPSCNGAESERSVAPVG